MASALEPHLHLEVGHILFLDIVGYSKLLADEQKELVQELNQIVRETKQFQTAEAEGKLMRLPTGDGMVLVFTNNPEAPVECALEISQKLQSRPQLKLRMGIHSGPVNPDISFCPNISRKTWSTMLTGDRIYTTSVESRLSTAPGFRSLIFTQIN